MSIAKNIKAVLRAITPAPIMRWRHKRRDLRYFREHYFGAKLRMIRPLVEQSGETHNFTYDLTDTNLRYLGEMVAVATGKSAPEIHGYIREAINDSALNTYFRKKMESHAGQKTPVGVASPFGRRLGWYAIVRATKPKMIVETGVERGHGSLILCAALLRNAAEGAAGTYFGTDINPEAGMLLGGPYAAVGRILYGDSIASLTDLQGQIDLFINDSDHSADYEAREYATVAAKLAPSAIVLGDNAHVTDKLARFAEATGRSFLMFREEPKNHWYPGAGIGIAFPD
jgi:predicted O-methyltransferase YrrM